MWHRVADEIVSALDATIEMKMVVLLLTLFTVIAVLICGARRKQ